ncbi:PREDICTED: uncharacterized protein LOC108370821 [Rhagoletis zephyria]|uniref:uncharacterized protein LOC108370821 n=1 Tax=Rhagoletis zephyria TaxID=28612 RepID=UPI00081177C6|nr:PREDICTED: uncharacterized protein LOC108370821 [Rhagoletis zephyria]
MLSDYWLGSPSANSINRFAPLSEAEGENPDDLESQRDLRTPKPPPILSGGANIQPLRQLLSEKAENEYIFKSLGRDGVKIQPTSDTSYSAITKAQIERKTEFHTYKVKSERNFNVVLKGLHYSRPVEDITKEI